MVRKLKGKNREYKFSDLSDVHKHFIVRYLGKEGASKTKWAFTPEYPMSDASALVSEMTLTTFTRDVESAKQQIEILERVEPILIDTLSSDEREWLLEGRYRVMAADEMGFKSVPAFVRVA